MRPGQIRDGESGVAVRGKGVQGRGISHQLYAGVGGSVVGDFLGSWHKGEVSTVKDS